MGGMKRKSGQGTGSTAIAKQRQPRLMTLLRSTLMFARSQLGFLANSCGGVDHFKLSVLLGLTMDCLNSGCRMWWCQLEGQTNTWRTGIIRRRFVAFPTEFASPLIHFCQATCCLRPESFNSEGFSFSPCRGGAVSLEGYEDEVCHLSRRHFPTRPKVAPLFKLILVFATC